MHVSGFSFIYPCLMALTIFGGSLEFVAVSMLLSPFAPLQTFLVALMIQARHLFYGIAMLDKFKGLGWKRWYLIFGMCDETFSINYSAKIPPDVDRGWFMFFVTLTQPVLLGVGLDNRRARRQSHQFQHRGLDFVLTAMFVVIFLEQLLKERKHYTAIIGLAASLGCLLFFGADGFLIPSMCVILLLLVGFRKPLEKAGGWS